MSPQVGYKKQLQFITEYITIMLQKDKINVSE